MKSQTSPGPILLKSYNDFHYVFPTSMSIFNKSGIFKISYNLINREQQTLGGHYFYLFKVYQEHGYTLCSSILFVHTFVLTHTKVGKRKWACRGENF